MKNCDRSDRELANALRVSQPMITRTKKKLVDEGIIREYTIVPDFSRLGHQLTGVTFIRLSETPSAETYRQVACHGNGQDRAGIVREN